MFYLYIYSEPVITWYIFSLWLVQYVRRSFTGHAICWGAPPCMKKVDIRHFLFCSVLTTHHRATTLTVILSNKSSLTMNGATNLGLIVTLKKCRKILCCIYKFSFAQIPQLCVLTNPLRKKWASSLQRILHGYDRSTVSQFREHIVNVSFSDLPIRNSCWMWWTLYRKKCIMFQSTFCSVLCGTPVYQDTVCALLIPVTDVCLFATVLMFSSTCRLTVLYPLKGCHLNFLVVFSPAIIAEIPFVDIFPLHSTFI